MNSLRIKLYNLLKWSERYAKTDMIYATKSGFWLMGNQIFGAFIAVLTSILFAHFLSKETFGTYRYILSVAGIFSAFTLTGMNAAVTRATAQGRDAIFITSLWVQLKWSLPQFLLALATGIYYAANDNYLYALAFGIIAVLSPFSSVANTFAPFLSGKKDFQRTAMYSFGSSIISFVLIAIASIFYQNLISLILAFYLGAFITNTYYCYRTAKIYPQTSKENVDDDIAYGKKLSLMNVVGTIAQQIDSIVVYKFLGPAELALYTFANIIPERVRSMFGIIATAAFPKIAEKKDESSPSDIKGKTIHLILLAGIIIVGYVILAPFIYKILFPQYVESVIYSQVLSLSILAIASNVSLPALFVKQKEKELYFISVGLPIVKIIISVTGIIFLGIWGAIIGKISHYVLHVLLSQYYGSKALS